MIKTKELQQKSAILRFCVGLGLCCVKLHHGIAFGTSLIGYHKVALETVSRFAHFEQSHRAMPHNIDPVSS